MTPNPKTLRLFRLDVFAEPLDSAAERGIALARQRRAGPAGGQSSGQSSGQTGGQGGGPALVFAINPEKTMQSTRDPAAYALMQQATLLIPDGIGVCLAARLLEGVALRRVPGSELMPALCARAEREDLGVYVYGASPASNAGAVAEMRRRWPGLRITGASDGFQAPDAVAAAITAARPDIVFVGLGSPRQERWMADVGRTLPVGLLQGVGGTIDVLSGTARRAPRAWQRLGLEWLYRLIENPSRWRRQLALVDFAAMVIRSRLLPGRADGSLNRR